MDLRVCIDFLFSPPKLEILKSLGSVMLMFLRELDEQLFLRKYKSLVLY